VRTRLSAAAPQVAVLGPLALVMGSRAGLSLEQIDDLAMAIELVVQHRRDERGAEFRAEPGSLEVFISEVDQAWLEHHLAMLAVLVSETELDAGGVRLRVNV
jgi:anti-sigma factor ChrR (cupin superfamily)